VLQLLVALVVRLVVFLMRLAWWQGQGWLMIVRSIRPLSRARR
jgi:hypothetical protein